MKNSDDFATWWRGRDDTEESGDARRWHHVMRPFDADIDGGAVLIGFPCDEGVRRNGGRVGAAGGPGALRAALANLPLLDEPPLADAGDVCRAGDVLDVAQAKLGETVARVLRQRALPVALGGGHEIALGTFQGIAAAHPRCLKLLIVNLDAHFDLREAKQGNSGTPFRQIRDWCLAHDWPFDYRVFGISRYANTRALFDRAEAFGVNYWLDEALQDGSQLGEAAAALRAEISRFDAVYLTICLDVLPAAIAPGVSAPGVLGVPLGHVERLIDVVAGSGRLIAADVAELNPQADRDAMTARVAARLVARLVRTAGSVG
ncbi:MAG TPA: formimidoylglutamase [Bradyrhizobium sp.]|nr:formimidoylglutamase [Bradyrhizobium sp.]